jgi:outer membrane protein
MKSFRCGLCLLAFLGAFTTHGRGEALSLTLEEAIRLASSRQGNAAVRLADEVANEIRETSMEARSALLPHLGGTVSQRRQTNNLEALGLRPVGLFSPPKLVGPFSTFDARAEVSQSLFNWSSLRRFRSSRAAADAAAIQAEHARDAVAAGAAVAYLEALRDRTRLDTARADVQLSEQLLALSRNQRDAGTGTGIEVTRAEVKLALDRQALLSAERTLSAALLELKRWLGIDLATDLVLLDELRPGPVPFESPDEALGRALTARRDLWAQLEQERAAELRHAAFKAERYPSVAGFANYGVLGLAPNDSIPTWTVGIRLEIPIFDGGGMEARRAQSLAALRRERVRTEDLREEIRLQVRLAYEALEVGLGEIAVAEEALDLARRELEQARRRYGAGVATSLEITEAQTNLKRAEEIRTGALFGFNLARVRLADAVGALREGIRP